MKLIGGYEFRGFQVIDQDGVEYIRWSPDNWCRYYGNSLEAEYTLTETLEQAFQDALQRGLIKE